MTFEEILDQAIAMLQRRGRGSCPSRWERTHVYCRAFRQLKRVLECDRLALHNALVGHDVSPISLLVYG
jgi:hypothetical protein